ncbi:hypothetical protein NQD34_011741 [Periophthalmus magnuspinnatus]|nr:hypothetical protein NQD34_011741 [Periophthalmus magnuspinnatus]
MQLVHLCTLLLISSVLSLSVADRDLDKEFEEWKKKYDKVYSTPEEEAELRAIWEETRKQVEAHNKEAEQGLHTYMQGLNQFSDLKEEEIRGCLLPVPELTPIGPIIPLLPLPIPDNSTNLNSPTVVEEK